MNKDLIEVNNLTKSEVESIIEKAIEFKKAHDKGIRRQPMLDGRVVALVFEKPSLRTKVAFEVATISLGGTVVFLSSEQILASGQQETGRESIPDIARNLERFCDIIVARVYHNEVLHEMAESIKIPVVNALCDQHHPTQALADLMAIRQNFGSKQDIKVAFIGDGNNVATSLLQLCAMSGINSAIATPVNYEIPNSQKEIALKLAKESNVNIEFTSSVAKALENADVVYSDTFVSMGQEKDSKKRLKDFSGYQINAEIMKLAKPSAIFMHCLPAHRGEEVTDEVMDSEQSIVFDQAECRLHIAKALLCKMLLR
jgi:ornithine carbamoyltransferase